MNRLVLQVLFAFLIVCSVPGTSLGQLRVISSGGIRAAYNEALPLFEKTTSITVATTSGGSQGDSPNTIGAQLRRGTPADIVIMSKEGLEDLIKEGRVDPSTAVDLAQTPLAVAVRAGAPHPDISTVDALRGTLLRAKSVTLQSSTTGIYMMKTMFPRLGVAEEVSRKLSDTGVAAVARGEAEITLQPLSELVHAPGAEVVGNVPDEVQFISVFSAAIVKGSQHLEEAKRLIAFLASSAADAAIRNNGMQRVVSR